MIWTRAEAIDFVAALDEKLTPRYHVGLTGSVLIKGSSTKDLDVIVYPASTAEQDKAFVVEKFLEAGLVKIHDVEVVHARWRRLKSQDTKHVEVWAYQGKRVDVFFLT